MTEKPVQEYTIQEHLLIHEFVMTLGAHVVWRMWKAMMEQQGREVKKEYQDWDILPARDKIMDAHIAYEVLRAFEWYKQQHPLQEENQPERWRSHITPLDFSPNLPIVPEYDLIKLLLEAYGLTSGDLERLLIQPKKEEG
jgi:hypothetical protein